MEGWCGMNVCALWGREATGSAGRISVLLFTGCYTLATEACLFLQAHLWINQRKMWIILQVSIQNSLCVECSLLLAVLDMQHHCPVHWVEQRGRTMEFLQTAAHKVLLYASLNGTASHVQRCWGGGESRLSALTSHHPENFGEKTSDRMQVLKRHSVNRRQWTRISSELVQF